MEKQWSELTKEEKREQRLKNYINPPPGTKFHDAAAERLYSERVDRLLKAKEPLKKPPNLSF